MLDWSASPATTGSACRRALINSTLPRPFVSYLTENIWSRSEKLFGSFRLDARYPTAISLSSFFRNSALSWSPLSREANSIRLRLVLIFAQSLVAARKNVALFEWWRSGPSQTRTTSMQRLENSCASTWHPPAAPHGRSKN
jgi:hypothetical protein